MMALSILGANCKINTHILPWFWHIAAANQVAAMCNVCSTLVCRSSGLLMVVYKTLTYVVHACCWLQTSWSVCDPAPLTHPTPFSEHNHFACIHATFVILSKHANHMTMTTSGQIMPWSDCLKTKGNVNIKLQDMCETLIVYILLSTF